jgi:hypothetical protein
MEGLAESQKSRALGLRPCGFPSLGRPACVSAAPSCRREFDTVYCVCCKVSQSHRSQIPDVVRGHALRLVWRQSVLQVNGLWELARLPCGAPFASRCLFLVSRRLAGLHCSAPPVRIETCRRRPDRGPPPQLQPCSLHALNRLSLRSRSPSAEDRAPVELIPAWPRTWLPGRWGGTGG